MEPSKSFSELETSKKRSASSTDADDVPVAKKSSSPATDLISSQTPSTSQGSSSPSSSPSSSQQGTPTKQKPSPQKFSPRKLTSPLKSISSVHGIIDGGADYRKPCTSSQCSVADVHEIPQDDEDPDLLLLGQDLDLDPHFGEDLDPMPHESVDWFSRLPLEVLENIFCRLPILDLCLHMATVCQRWNSIISNPQFLTWKKNYFRILRGSKEHKEVIFKKLTEGDMDLQKPVTLLPGIIRLMANFKPETSRNMTECLRRHPKYSWATALIEERVFPATDNHDTNPWSVVTAIVVLSEDVNDILRLLVSLLTPPSQCTGTEVIECLYNIATFLLVFRDHNYQECWTGMHYRVFYALYLYENSSVIVPDPDPRLTRQALGKEACVPEAPTKAMQYTQEQLRICNHRVDTGDVVKIIAFAGTGKTTTLMRYTQLRPHTKFLLIVFNKSTEADCKRRFPQNVTCMTVHSLAFHTDIARKYQRSFRIPGRKKPKNKIGQIYVGDLIRGNHITFRKGENIFTQAKFIVETLKAFMASADREINHSHVPLCTKNKSGEMEYIGAERRANIVEDADKIWKKMTNPKDHLSISHDGYLKLYQLSSPRIKFADVILVDEAQDQTPAVIDILKKQTQAKILVGDPNQQIYSFRGAVNAMNLFPASSVFYLTQSFRFGSNIAHVANTCLEVLKGVGPKILVGNTSKGYIDGTRVGQLAILTRTNFTLFKEAVRKCSYSANPVTVAFPGGTQGLGFYMIEDIYHLFNNDKGKITNDFIKSFKGMADLENYATSMSDLELGSKIKIVLTYQHQVLDHMKRISHRCVENLDDADLVLSTAHKSKGLEFQTVRLTDDFMEDVVPHGAQNATHPFLQTAAPKPQGQMDEQNLLYVAVTRAKRALQLTSTLMRVLHFAGERFRYPCLTSTLPPEPECVLTGMKFEPCALTLRRNAITLGTAGVKQSAGLYSPQVVSQDLPAVSGLYGLREPLAPGERLDRTAREPHWLPGGQQVLPAALLGLVMDWPGVAVHDDGEDEDVVDINVI